MAASPCHSAPPWRAWSSWQRLSALPTPGRSRGSAFKLAEVDRPHRQDDTQDPEATASTAETVEDAPDAEDESRSLSPFDFRGSKLRAINHQGEVLFVGRDVASTLGYVNTRQAIIDHCKAPIRVDEILRRGGRDSIPPSWDSQLVLIPERDVYRLGMRSTLPAAEEFEEWVVGTVLPSIRRRQSAPSARRVDSRGHDLYG
jgi:prophage antirepressor-like protein